MKITHVVRQFCPSVGGLEASVLNLAANQRNRLALDANVVTLDRVFGSADVLLPKEEIVDGVPVRRLPWRGSTRYPLAPSVLAHLHAADIIHVHAVDFFFDFLALTRPLHKQPMIASTHGGFFHTGDFNLLKKIWFNTVTRLSVLGYHRVVACSHADAELFQNVAGERLRVIENGIDQRRFADAASHTSTKTIICFGRFAAHKRIAALFALLAELRRKDTEWRLILAGRDADQTSLELRALANAAGVADALNLVEGPSDAELRDLIGQASYFACLSAYEGFGLAAVEAMSAGLYPVLSSIPPFRRFIGNAGIGLVVDPDRPADAAEALANAVSNDEDTYNSRRVRIADAVRQYDWSEVATEYVKLYKEAIGTPGRALSPGRVGLET
ncbi:MAG: glycosyltransferase family 4 protein [Rhodospirillales bacterium]|nr:glycosyltransferase family 4 protein [Rhodospirillales bacterium]